MQRFISLSYCKQTLWLVLDVQQSPPLSNSLLLRFWNAKTTSHLWLKDIKVVIQHTGFLLLSVWLLFSRWLSWTFPPTALILTNTPARRLSAGTDLKMLSSLQWNVVFCLLSDSHSSGLPTNHSSADGNLSFLVAFEFKYSPTTSLLLRVLLLIQTHRTHHSITASHHVLSWGSLHQPEVQRRGGERGFFFFPSVVW